MTTLLSIKQAIGNVLEQNGYTIYASEIDEGFEKPCCFVELSSFARETTNYFMQVVSAVFDVLYVPEIQTDEHIIEIADRLSALFCNLDLKVGDRSFSIERAEVEIENGNIKLSLEFSFTDSAPNGVAENVHKGAENIVIGGI